MKNPILACLNKKSYDNYSIISKVQRDFNRNGELSVNNTNELTLNDAKASVGNWNFSNYTEPKREIKGALKILLLNTHFTGAKEMPTEKIKSALFGGNGQYSSLSEYISLASRNALSLTEGKTLDNLDIGSAGNTCDTTLYRQKAIELAREQGINPNDYDLIYIEHTQNSKCTNAAVATYPSKLNVPGKYIVVNNSGEKYWMWTHEFGHTLGFKHSNILVGCPATDTGIKVDSTCKIGGRDTGINDKSDTMGGGGGKMYPVNYMYEAGWLTDEQFPVVNKGTYKIEPLLSDKGGTQGLRIARSNPNFPYLTLEFRQPDKFDRNWPENSPFINGVIVRQISPTPLQSYNVIIHTIPGSTSRDTPPLMPGKTLYDTYSGKLITVDSISKDGAVVTISDHKELN